MIFNPFRKNPATDAVYAVYSAIVAQSRQSRFYAEWGIADTVTGRFDMICLHLVLLFRRLRAEKGSASEFGQAVFDLFFKDMDRSLRELGAGDLAVPKKIQKMGSIFYGLLASLSAALDAGDAAAVEAVLVRNLYEDRPGPHAAQLAAYLLEQSARLAAQPVEAITAGDIDLARAA
jgi:cytochrome b pre-mRNA-processing protein 3